MLMAHTPHCKDVLYYSHFLLLSDCQHPFISDHPNPLSLPIHTVAIPTPKCTFLFKSDLSSGCIIRTVALYQE